MPFSHNRLKTTTGIQVFSQLSYRFLYGNVQRCVFAKNRPVSLKAAQSVTFDLLIFEIMFLVFKNTVKTKIQVNNLPIL